MGQLQYKIIRTKHLDFILTPTKIYFQTRLQANYLYPREAYWLPYQDKVRQRIISGRIRDLDTLAYYCRDKLMWVPTQKFVDITSTSEYHQDVH